MENKKTERCLFAHFESYSLNVFGGRVVDGEG